ncbi:MAG: hypothetical protein ACI9PY_002982 [Ascidiaceihabitans sp.]|jgi:hypothetical protein
MNETLYLGEAKRRIKMIRTILQGPVSIASRTRPQSLNWQRHFIDENAYPPTERAKSNVALRALAFPDPDVLSDQIFGADQKSQSSTTTTLKISVVYWIVVCASLSFGIAAVWIAWPSGLSLIPKIAVYFAAANAIILGAAVAFALFCSESYDID